MLYRYQVINGQGIRYQGQLEAETRAEAALRLQLKGLFVIRLQADWLGLISRLKEAQDERRQLVLACRQLSVMVRAGIPAGEGVRVIASGTGSSKDRIAAAFSEVYCLISGGASLSEAMKGAGGLFPLPLIAAVRAGEAGGILEEVLDRQASSMEKDYRSSQQLKTALAYPVFLLLMLVVMVAFMLIAVLPVFAALFDDMSAELPWNTRFLLAMGELLSENWQLILVMLLSVVVLVKQVKNNSAADMRLNQLLLRIPYVGRLIQLSELRCWLDTMSMLLAGGVLADEAVRLSASVLENSYLRQRLRVAEALLTRGEDIYDACCQAGCFPVFVLELINVGNASGEMVKMLAEGAAICQLEAETIEHRIEALAEPVAVLLTGALTGFIVLSIIWPVLEMLTIYSHVF